MEKFIGKSVYGGIVLGKIHVWKKKECDIKHEIITSPDAEIGRIAAARKRAIHQLKALYEKAVKEVGEYHAAIFEVHQMMLEDEDYLDFMENIIRTQMVNAEYAAAVTGSHFAGMFAGMEDAYMQARDADVKDITERLIQCLSSADYEDTKLTEPAIIVAEDLTPGEMVSLEKENILAFVTVGGSANSHTAILARTMNIPALIGVDIDLCHLADGTEALVDGFTGAFVVEPSEKLKSQAKVKMETEAEQKHLLQKLIGKETITQNGKKINLYANVGSISDVACAIENDAEGIGLFRSEFLYIGRDELPSEEEQYNIYKQAAQSMAGRRVIVRTFDIGADKRADYLQLPQEENPALGYRAIRIGLTHPEIFKTQLRALYRAAVYGNISIMYPMIISTEEVEVIKKISAQVKAELAAEGIAYKDAEEGIMIETPAAVMISDELAEMVDFFSIGTNDLTQYTLAIDRQNEKLDSFYNPHHKAVLKMIRMVIENAHKAGKWAAICGELGADTALTEEFVKMGVDELSVAPGAVLGIRKIIRNMNAE
uniref:phosphoenolpyruvate--protein phosphotransferase n=1 Tax=Agathobacter sp. TaxID=2021311 RepID=UPI0040560D59